MRRSIRLLILILLITLSPAARTPAADGSEPAPAVRPGTEGLTTEVLRPFEARYAMTRQGNAWAQAVITLAPSAVAGEPAWRHAYRMDFSGQTVYDETLLLRKSLAPAMKFIHGGMGPELAYKLYTYQDGGLRGSLVFADGRETAALSQEFDGAVFGAGTDMLVLASMKLQEGVAGRLISADDAGLHPNPFQVEGRETVTIAGSSYDTAVVSVMGGMGKLWIARQPPYLVRQEFPAAGIAWTLESVSERVP